MLRVAARDLDGGDLDEVVSEISDVADACLEPPRDGARDGLRRRRARASSAAGS